MIFSTFLSLIAASSLMAAPQAPVQSPALTCEIDDYFSYQGLGPHQQGLIWAKVCDKPWNAYYIFKCTSGPTLYSRLYAVEGNNLFQGPKIRVGPDGLNTCAKQGSTMTVWRLRNGVGEDITDKLTSFDGTQKYDGKDAIFWDQYKMDC